MIRVLLLLFLGYSSSQAQIIRAQPFYEPVGGTLLLDLYPNANAAYSIRKVNSSYNGNCLRVRRRTDNAEQNIGFVNNVLDTASLKTFVGTTSTDTGFVVTWYDQSGNGRDITQAAATSQPRILTSGVLNRQGSNAAINFSTRYLTRTDAIGLSGTDIPISSITVVKNNGTIGSGNFLWSAGSSASLLPIFGLAYYQQASTNRLSSYKRDDGGTLAQLFSTTVVNITTRYLFDVYHTGTATTTYINAGLENNAVSQDVGTLTLNRFGLGGLIRASNSQAANNVDYQEVVIWQSNQLSNASGIRSNVNAFYSIY